MKGRRVKRSSFEKVGPSYSFHRPRHLDPLWPRRMPSQLEGAMDALIAVFYNYSGHDGDKYKLNKGELKQLLHSELTDFLTSQKDPLLVEKIMNDLDSNKDNEVDFNEFVVLVAALTVACNDFFQEQQKKTK
ncbi:protein S100-Z isoform X2 [Entelurus aequoreus]|nr:protein S100-Z isoform X2 [Entelurus aequoreus]